MTPHAVAGSPPTASRVATATRFVRARRPARPVTPPRTRLTRIRPLVVVRFAPTDQPDDAEADRDAGDRREGGADRRVADALAVDHQHDRADDQRADHRAN